METDIGEFQILTQQVVFNQTINTIKNVVKNVSFKSTSYDVRSFDPEHFQLIGQRGFTLAPGMSRNIQIRHIPGPHCMVPERQLKRFRVTNSFQKSSVFSCKCPMYTMKQQQKYITYPEYIEVGEFDKSTTFSFDVHNYSTFNLKASVADINSPNFELKVLTEDTIILSGESATFQASLKVFEHGIVQKAIIISVSLESNKFLQQKKIQSYEIMVKGESVSRSLQIQDQNYMPMNELKRQILNGTSTKGYFYIDNHYHKEITYTISGQIKNVDTPMQFANKWKSFNISFPHTSGLFKSQAPTKIQYQFNSSFSEDDDSYVRKFSQIPIDDNDNSIRMLNSPYAKKYIDMFIQINANFGKSGEETEIVLPIRCVLVNPSLRFRFSSEDSTFLVKNQTHLPVPFSFSPHSLYRISMQKGQFSPNSTKMIKIKWNKNNQKCSIFLQLSEIDLIIFDAKEIKDKKVITRPSTRIRPVTTQKLIRQKSIPSSYTGKNTLSRPQSGFLPLRPMTPGARQQMKSTINKNYPILKQLPKNIKLQKISEQEVGCILQWDRTVRNTHPTATISLYVIDMGYILLSPGQGHTFSNKNTEQIRYKINGFNTIFKIQAQKENLPIMMSKNFGSSMSGTNNFFAKETALTVEHNTIKYKVMLREIKMSFKESSKHDFQIIDYIPIKNYSLEPLKVDCISVDGQFFQCKEPQGTMIIPSNQIGKFKIGFFPRNIIQLSALERQPPRQTRRLALFSNINEGIKKSNTSEVRKTIKLLINKNTETIDCVGELQQKKCQIRPQKINFTECKYGSPQTVQSFIITNLSTSNKIKFLIQNPKQVIIKPKMGTIDPKQTHTCSVYFRPCKKITNFSDHIKVFIGGSHLELVPLAINVEDPDIFIKETEILVQDYAVCGTQRQQLRAQMTIVNNNPSQSFLQLDLKNTPLYLGLQNQHKFSADRGLVMENFIRCATISREQKIHHQSNKRHDNFQSEEQLPDQFNQHQKCSITIPPNTFLIVPLALRLSNVSIGDNTINLNPGIITLVGYGSIRSPQRIKFKCKKTLLHITPFKSIHEIVLTKNMNGHKISIKNTIDKIIRVRTAIKPIRKQNEEVSMVCTFKDIDDYLKPEKSIDLNMGFIFFEAQKQAIRASYNMNIFVAEDIDDPNFQIPYFTTRIQVLIPEPFLEISPWTLIMPTVAPGVWSRSSFAIENHGFKEIFVKIKKPNNITFDFQYQITDPSDDNKSRKNLNSSRNLQKNTKYLENQLTKLRNSLIVKISFKSKTKISFNTILVIEDNLGKKYNLTVAGTCTDSPFFAIDSPAVTAIVSSQSINSSSEISCSSTNLKSNGIVRKSQHVLDSSDIEDLLFINNWLGNMLSEISNQSTFFYVWLTKPQNLLKFLREFNVFLQGSGNDKKKSGSSVSLKKYDSIEIILEQLKKQGFQLNSIRIELLEKADQIQWLNFMWFFFSKAVLCPNFLKWITDILNQPQPLTYALIQKNFTTLISNLVVITMNPNKETSLSNKYDWQTLTQKYEPLLGIFKNVESVRHIILSLNILYHKLSNIQTTQIEVTNFQLNLNIQNHQKRKVRYFMLCDSKIISCQDCSNKTMPTEINGGYSFTVEENECMDVSMGVKATQFNKKNNSLNIILMNNVLWDPITIYTIKVKPKQDVVHEVVIECEDKYTQQWVYKYECKMASEYRIHLEGAKQFKILSNCNLGYMKKGDHSIIRVSFSPDSMKKQSAILYISNGFFKEVFQISGKPLHSRKIQYEKQIRVTKDQVHCQTLYIPWQFNPYTTNLQENYQAKTNSSRLEKRSNNAKQANYKIIQYGDSLPQVLQKNVEYLPLKKQMKVDIKFKFDKLYRNVETLFQILKDDESESKIIRLMVDVAPKRIILKAQIESPLDKITCEPLKIKNLYNIPEGVMVSFKPIQKEEDILRPNQNGSKKDKSVQNGSRELKKIGKNNLNNYEEKPSPFEMLKVKNNELVVFTNPTTGQTLKQIEVGLKCHPKSQQQQESLFCLTLNYQESLHQIIYLFCLKIKTDLRKNFQQSHTITHNCQPLKRQKHQIQLINTGKQTLNYIVETDLHMVKGQSFIKIWPQSIALYEYELYCLHMGSKTGQITFKDKNGLGQQIFELTVNVKKQENTNRKKDLKCNNVQSQELCIFQDSFEVRSTIRKGKTFSILLQNKSDREIEYDVIWDCDSLSASNFDPITKRIKLAPLKESPIEILYQPLFIGEKKTQLSLYNPNQPQISYQIIMISQPEEIVMRKLMPGIGVHQSIPITINNPLNKGVTAQLSKLIFNKKQLEFEQWEQHLGLSIFSEGKFTTVTNLRQINLQKKTNSKFNLLIKPLKLMDHYIYQLQFTTSEIGDLTCFIQLEYPKEQVIEPLIMHVNSGQEIEGTLQFINHFEKNLSLQIQYPQQYVKALNVDEIERKKKMMNFQKLSTSQIKLSFKSKAVEFKVILVCPKSGYKWVYPIIIYEVYVHDVKPINIVGSAGQIIPVKLYPSWIVGVSNIQIATEKEDKQGINLNLAHQNIRMRKSTQANISFHQVLPQNKLYQIQIELVAIGSTTFNGFFNLYQEPNKKNNTLSPIDNQNNNKKKKDSVFNFQRPERRDSEISNFSSKNLLPLKDSYIVQKIPFQLKITPSKSTTIEFEANVGQIVTIRIKFSQFSPALLRAQKNRTVKSIASNRSIASKTIDNEVQQKKYPIEVELFNNKCREFSVIVNWEQECLEISYHAKEYSSLKKAKMEVKVGDVLSEFQLIGKYPKKM